MDSAAWIALTVTTDPDHASARSFYRNLRRSDRLLTTNYVVSETITWLRYHVSHAAALRAHTLIEAAEKTGLVEIHWITVEAHNRAWLVFESYADPLLSFIDCTSAVVAREIRADYIFSFDRDFRIFGFDVRPRP